MTSHTINFISLSNNLDVLTVTVDNADRASIRNLKAAIKQELDITIGVTDIEIFMINASLRISTSLFLDLPNDAQLARIREFLASATFLKSAHLLSNILPANEYDSQAIHFIVNYPRYITLSYVAYIHGDLHHESDIVISNKLTVSGLRGTIAKELERRDRFLKLYSVWDGFLIDGELPKTLIITAGRIQLDTHAVLSNVFPFEAERRVDVIVCVGDIFNIHGMNTGLQPGMDIAKVLHPPLEELKATRRPNKAGSKAMGMAVQYEAGCQMAEERQQGGQEPSDRKPLPRDQKPSPEDLVSLVKQDKLEAWKVDEASVERPACDKCENLEESCKPGDNVLKSCEGYQVTGQKDGGKVSEGEKTKVKPATEEVDSKEGQTVSQSVMDYVKTVVEEQQRQTDLLTTALGKQTDLVTALLAEQRQYFEWARQHGENVENLLL
ncbi:hypothetical protein APHAL10511_007624 [Amanita phalloides]|nr:hypothetical protein APHAL10511_007624 [Amanita phalloides]